MSPTEILSPAYERPEASAEDAAVAARVSHTSEDVQGDVLEALLNDLPAAPPVAAVSPDETVLNPFDQRELQRGIAAFVENVVQDAA